MTAPRVIPVAPDPSSSAWHEQRRRGIGSSDAAAILGMSPFASAYSIWVEKVESLPWEDTPATKWGRKLEAVIADEFAERHPELRVEQPTVMYAHAEHEWMQANPDRLLYTAADTLVGLLEIKTSNWDDEWRDGPPDSVLLQVQHQLAVMDLPTAYVALLMHGRDYREWKVERDEATIAVLIEHEAEFWRRVVECDPPAPDGSAASTDAVKWLFRDASDGEVEGGERAAGLLRKRAALKTEVAEAQRRLNAIENEIKVLLGENTRLLVDGEKAASWTPVLRESFDHEAFAADYPDLAAKYTKTSSYRRLTFTKGWGK